jgi:outer membrane protein OmpA-like peptidoglycan-associated protein
MPKTRARETIFAFGVVMGATLAGAASADDAMPASGRMVVAQNAPDQNPDEDRRKRRQQQQQENQQQRHDQGGGGGDHRKHGQDDGQRQQRGGGDQDERQHRQGQGQPGPDDRQRQRAQDQDQGQGQGREQFRQKHDDDRQKRDAEERFRRDQADKAREKAQAEQERAKQARDKAQAEQERARQARDKAQAEQERAKQIEQQKADQDKRERGKRDADQDRFKKDADQGHNKDADRFRQGGKPLGGPDNKQAGPDDRDRRDRFDKRREAIKDRFEEKTFTREEREQHRKAREEFTHEKLKDITSQRKEHKDASGRLVIEEPDKRRIVRFNNRVIIQHDETERLRGAYKDVRRERGPNGHDRTIIVRPGGVKIINVVDDDGHLLRRVKVLPDGREFVLINNEYRGHHRHRDDDRGGFGFYVDLPDFRPPERDYYIYANDADENEIEDVLTAPPLDDLRADYTLDEIRYSPDIRRRLRKLDLNTLTFEFGSWEVRPDQIDRLKVVARVIKRIVEDNPDEVFLIAGHTDAVGSDEDNLSLSDRRAESVARVLTDEFGVPPENLVTQGYGESELLVPSSGPEERNRRVEFMRVTGAMAQNNQQ